MPEQESKKPALAITAILIPIALVALWLGVENADLKAFPGHAGMIVAILLYMGTIAGLGVGVLLGIIAFARSERPTYLSVLAIVLNIAVLVGLLG